MILAAAKLFSNKLLLIGLAGCLAAGFTAGYKWHAGKVAIDELNKREAIEEELAAVKESNDRLTVLYLTESQKRKEVVREKVRKVVEYVNNDTCSLTDDGMHSLNCQLRPSQCAAKPTSALQDRSRDTGK